MCKYTGSVLVNGIEWQLSAEYFCCKYKIILDSFKYPYSWPKYLRIKTFLTSNWVLLTRNKPKLDLHGVLPYTEIIIPDLGTPSVICKWPQPTSIKSCVGTHSLPMKSCWYSLPLQVMLGDVVLLSSPLPWKLHNCLIGAQFFQIFFYLVKKFQ